MSGRPAVSVVVPFAGRDAELVGLVARLAVVILRDGDEVIVADNRRSAAGADRFEGRVRILGAPGLAAPGFARNRAAAVAAGGWLVFVDADTTPSAGLLDVYFDPLPGERTAVLAGGIIDRPGSAGVAGRVTAERGQMSQRSTLDRPGTPYAQTANCAVRRSAFAAVGGFDETARSGEDADLCFRLLAAGWGLEERPDAVVEHPTRGTLGELLRQLAVHGGGVAWLDRRYPGEFPAPRPGAVCRRAMRSGYEAGVAAWRRDWEAAQAGVVEVASGLAFELGRRRSNQARRS